MQVGSRECTTGAKCLGTACLDAAMPYRQDPIRLLLMTGALHHGETVAVLYCTTSEDYSSRRRCPQRSTPDAVTESRMAAHRPATLARLFHP